MNISDPVGTLQHQILCCVATVHERPEPRTGYYSCTTCTESSTAPVHRIVRGILSTRTVCIGLLTDRAKGGGVGMAY